jgi:hypothetical protein
MEDNEEADLKESLSMSVAGGGDSGEEIKESSMYSVHAS